MNYSTISKEFNPDIFQPNYLVRKKLLQKISDFATQLEGDLLDFGCGSKPYYNLFKVNRYIGLDFENPGHPHINEKIDVFYDGHKMPFDNNSFDAVFSSEVLEHVFNPAEIFSELNRVLKVDGKILLTCPFCICEHEVPNDYARYSSFALKHLFETYGFEIIALEKTGNNIETIAQLRLMYIHQHILPYIKKIPVVRFLFRKIVYGFLNLNAMFCSKIFPNRNDLYLNNVILAKKVKNL